MLRWTSQQEIGRKTVKYVIIVAIAILIVVPAALVAVLVVLSRKVVSPRSPKFVDIEVDEEARLVRLPISPTTTAEGEHGLWFGRSGHARVGTVVRLDPDTSHVWRQVLEISGDESLVETNSGHWSGHAFGRPEHAGDNVLDVEVETPSGRLPSWVFQSDRPADDSQVWAIHVHGIRTSRFSALRTVPVASRLGFSSLVPCYFGDVEATETEGEPCYLGQREWIDVEAAIEYAVSRGAKKIYIFGWSMGSTIALLLAERSRYRHLIAGLVLVSPATDMRATITHAAQDAGLPKWLASLVPSALGTRLVSSLSGLKTPIDFAALDFYRPSNRITIPTLVIHSEGDTDIPISLSRRFAESNPRHVTLVELPPAPHQLEWNASPVVFDETIVKWIRRLEAD